MRRRSDADAIGENAGKLGWSSDYDETHYQWIVTTRDTAPPTRRTLSPSIQDQAAAFFFANYVLSDPPFSNTYLRWLSRLHAEESSGDIVNAAVEAVGLAGMANIYRAPGLQIEAKRRYGRALARINRALRDPVEVTADSTLVGILTLGLFEVG